MKQENKIVKCIRTDRMTGIKKGEEYEVVDEEYDFRNIKVKVNGEDIWFRNYYFEEIK